jgi:ribosomal protein S18 acetylase RimI-like enzyme
MATAVAVTRAFVSEFGAGALVVDDLTVDDLPHITWSGSATHLRNVVGQLRRAKLGELDYLAARAPDRSPVAKGSVDFAVEPGTGTIFQLATHPELQRLGIGTHLIRSLEERARTRGLPAALECENESARRLYERLGYSVCGESSHSWEAERDDGSLYMHGAVCTEMVKRL